MTETINDLPPGDVAEDGTPHLHFLQEPHPAGCRHEGLSAPHRALGKVFATQEPVDRDGKVSWLDVWQTVDNLTGDPTAVIVLRQAIYDDEGYCETEHVRPIATMLDPDMDNVGRFDIHREG